jgi:hypothetical protein
MIVVHDFSSVYGNAKFVGFPKREKPNHILSRIALSSLFLLFIVVVPPVWEKDNFKRLFRRYFDSYWELLY